MNKLDEIKKVLNENPDITWNEQSALLPYRRSRKGSYCSVGFRIAPKEPIPNERGLKYFTAELMDRLIPIGPSSVSRCYDFPGVKRQIVRIGTLYYFEMVEDPAEPNGMERWITLSIYPCQVMAENLGFRGLIELKRYECPDPCKVAKSCAYKASRSKTHLNIG